MAGIHHAAWGLPDRHAVPACQAWRACGRAGQNGFELPRPAGRRAHTVWLFARTRPQRQGGIVRRMPCRPQLPSLRFPLCDGAQWASTPAEVGTGMLAAGAPPPGKRWCRQGACMVSVNGRVRGGRAAGTPARRGPRHVPHCLPTCPAEVAAPTVGSYRSCRHDVGAGRHIGDWSGRAATSGFSMPEARPHAAGCPRPARRQQRGWQGGPGHDDPLPPRAPLAAPAADAGI